MEQRNMFQKFKIERETISERIVTQFVELIKDKQLKPGDKLPPERELAQTLGVGRQSLREALRALALLNIIEIIPGQGTYITVPSSDIIVDQMEVAFALNDTTFLHLIEARKLLEVAICGLAAERIKGPEVALLEKLFQKATDAAKEANYDEFLESDVELHNTLAKATKNPVLCTMLDVIGKFGLASRERTTRVPGIMEKVLNDHRRIIRAVARHDSAAAREAMEEHLNSIQEALQSTLRNP